MLCLTFHFTEFMSPILYLPFQRHFLVHPTFSSQARHLILSGFAGVKQEALWVVMWSSMYHFLALVSLSQQNCDRWVQGLYFYTTQALERYILLNAVCLLENMAFSQKISIQSKQQNITWHNMTQRVAACFLSIPDTTTDAFLDFEIVFIT